MEASMMKLRNALVACILCTVFPRMCLAQESRAAEFKKGYVEFGGDYFRPSGSSSSLFSRSGAGYGALGFRPLRHLQIDGVQAEFFPASSSRQITVQFSDGTFGTRTVNGRPSLLSFGGRFVLPLWREKVLVSAGGGWSGIDFSESIQTFPNEQGICITCQFHRAWGPTEIAEVTYFPGDQRNVGFGFHVRGVQAITNGLSADGSSLPGKNHFALIGGSISIRFK
jgi:hypothetical protein